MKKTILLLVDSHYDDVTLIDYAVTLAKSHQAFLELFDARWIVHTLPLELASTSIVKEMRSNTKAFQDSKEKMESLFTVVREKYPLTNYKIVKSVISGQFSNKENFWIDEIKSIQPKAVVMRVENELNLWNEMFGTAETKVAEQANCPVLLIPKKLGDFKPIQKIGYFLDREKPMEEAIHEVKFLINVAVQFDGEVKIYYISDTKKDDTKMELALVRSQFQKALDWEKLYVQDFSSSDTSKLVNDLVKVKVNHLMAFPKRQKSFLQRLKDNDNTKRLILNANVPVLVF